MGCLLALGALFFPRVILLLVWFFSDYLEAAYTTVLWPILGFFFMPLTTLAYAFAWHYGIQGEISGIGIAVIVMAALCDFGSLGGGGHASRKRKIVEK